MLPRPTANNSNSDVQKSTTAPSASGITKKAVIYVSGGKKPQKHNPPLDANDSDSSAKESEDEDYEVVSPPPEGVSASEKAKLQRLQIRNLKRLREKVRVLIMGSRRGLVGVSSGCCLRVAQCFI